jgi:hypothetical protein
MENNNQPKEYAATVAVSGQMTEDHWEMSYPMMKVTPETTMAEIDRFYRKYYPNVNAMLEVRINELQPIPPVTEEFKPF